MTTEKEHDMNPLNLNIGEEDEREKWVTAPERESTPEPVTVPAPSVPAPATTPAEPVKV